VTSGEEAGAGRPRRRVFTRSTRRGSSLIMTNWVIGARAARCSAGKGFTPRIWPNSAGPVIRERWRASEKPAGRPERRRADTETSGCGRRTRNSRLSSRGQRPPWRWWESTRALGTALRKRGLPREAPVIDAAFTELEPLTSVEKNL
jgi:hypothetical protein